MKLIFTYTIIAGIIAGVTGPIPGSSILLTLLELVMIIHLAKHFDYHLGLKDIFGIGSLIWTISTALKDLAVELFWTIWWLDFGLSQIFVASVFVFVLGIILRYYFNTFKKKA